MFAYIPSPTDQKETVIERYGFCALDSSSIYEVEGGVNSIRVIWHLPSGFELLKVRVVVTNKDSEELLLEDDMHRQSNCFLHLTSNPMLFSCASSSSWAKPIPGDQYHLFIRNVSGESLGYFFKFKFFSMYQMQSDQITISPLSSYGKHQWSMAFTSQECRVKMRKEYAGGIIFCTQLIFPDVQYVWTHGNGSVVSHSQGLFISGLYETYGNYTCTVRLGLWSDQRQFIISLLEIPSLVDIRMFSGPRSAKLYFTFTKGFEDSLFVVLLRCFSLIHMYSKDFSFAPFYILSQLKPKNEYRCKLELLNHHETHYLKSFDLHTCADVSPFHAHAIVDLKTNYSGNFLIYQLKQIKCIWRLQIHFKLCRVDDHNITTCHKESVVMRDLELNSNIKNHSIPLNHFQCYSLYKVYVKTHLYSGSTNWTYPYDFNITFCPTANQMITPSNIIINIVAIMMIGLALIVPVYVIKRFRPSTNS